MDNMNEQTGDILPQPQPSSRERAPVTSSQHLSGGEVAPSSQENSGARSLEAPHTVKQPQISSQQQAVQPLNDHSSNIDDASASTPASAPMQLDPPMIADDNDLIEKEWVIKAKQIVEQTKDDPYNQNEQIVRLRADYLKKRYNKDIKMSKE
jgi:hypothetical protein